LRYPKAISLMNNLKDDAAAALQQINSLSKGELEALFLFPGELAVFAGHFPGRPIVPGVLEVEMVRAAMERFTGLELRIISVERAKFLREVKPGDTVKAQIVFALSGGRYTVRGKSAVNGEKAAQVEMTLEKQS